MIDTIGITKNFVILPTPVLDESQPEGYRMEDRLQVTLVSAANEKPYTIEFRLGDDSQAPSEQQLTQWLEEATLVQAFCTGLSPRPFLHQKDKTYQRPGRVVQFGDQKLELDAFVVFAGVSMAPLEGVEVLEAAVKQARASFKRQQRQYQAQRNAARVEQIKQELPERVRQMKERRVQQEAENAAQSAQQAQLAETGSSAEAANGRRR